MKKSVLLLFTFLLPFAANSQNTTLSTETKTPYTILLLLNATPKWLSLSRDQRAHFFESKIIPVIAQVSPAVNTRFFDSEYFHSTVSDFIIVTTKDLNTYELLIEKLRDTKLYGEPYFEVKDIIMGRENAFEQFNKQLKDEK